MITIHPIHAYSDNYIWLIQFGDHQAAVVDPGQAEPVLAALQHHGLQLAAILITHEHWDHVNGIEALLQHHQVPVYGAANGPIPHLSHPCHDNDLIHLGELELRVIEVPGHTQAHIAFYGHNSLFTGDTLFAAGCGRIMGGTAAQLHDSLNKIAKLPIDTHIYCAHEYTLSNLRFAQAVEPGNSKIGQRNGIEAGKRQQGQPTLPSTLRQELETNPFLRCHEKAVVASAEQFAGKQLNDSVAVFKALRYWKDGFT